MKKPLVAVQMLTDGKNDTELLEAMVMCLTDNDNDLVKKLVDAANYQTRDRANIEVLFAICAVVRDRGSIKEPTYDSDENEDDDDD